MGLILRVDGVLKKIVRTICHTNRRASAAPLYISLGLLNLRHIYKYAVGNCVYKLLSHGTQSSTLTHRNVTYNTRASDQRYLEVPLALSTHSEQSILIAGPVIYNCIPLEVRLCESYDLFKFNYKKKNTIKS